MNEISEDGKWTTYFLSSSTIYTNIMELERLELLKLFLIYQMSFFFFGFTAEELKNKSLSNDEKLTKCDISKFYTNRMG